MSGRLFEEDEISKIVNFMKLCKVKSDDKYSEQQKQNNDRYTKKTTIIKEVEEETKVVETET